MNYKDINNCIYILECKINNKKYIGSTNDIEKKIENHYRKLYNNKHNKYIQEDFNKYGKENFRFIILETINIKTNSIEEINKYLDYMENYYIDIYKTHIKKYGNTFGYNVNKNDKLDINDIDVNKSFTKKLNIIIELKDFIENKKVINELVKLYFDVNPNMNKGIGFRAKANDIIKSYVNIHNKSYEEIKSCIESYPMTKIPIWTQFDNYFNKKDNNKNDEKSSYKNSINDSTNIDDWI